ncbi:MAG: FAD-dependent oxidoreductase, partial [Pseudomonadota bacterium]
MAPVTVKIEGDMAWVTIDNPPVNATSTAVRAGLLDAVRQVQSCRLAVLRGAGRTFVAGGDMGEFDRPPEEPHLPDIVDAIESSDTPFLALLHGSVLGGGFEIALGCPWRIAAPGTRFGLPEVNVGLVPGAGGTQRAPRLLGWAASVDMACRSRMLDAAEMLDLGGIDRIEDDLETTACAFDAPRPTAISARTAPPLDPDWAEDTRCAIAAKAKGQAAPLHAFEALTWAKLPFSNGQPKERKLHLGLRQSDESRALRHVFFAERAVTKPAAIRDGIARDIAHVAVVGGGLMGTGIAAACLNAGLRVSLVEQDKAAAAAAQDRVAGLLAGALKRGKIGQVAHDAQLEAFSTGAGHAAATDADLAIEAIFEDVTAKRAVFADLQAAMRPDAMLATNTSYLDPRDIFADIPDQTRCLGLHFFAPAHIMRLLEVVRLPGTSADTLATAFTLAKRLRKVPVLSGICDGFIGNRMLAAYRRAAEYMLADGALPWDVDAAM